MLVLQSISFSVSLFHCLTIHMCMFAMLILVDISHKILKQSKW